MTDPCKVNIEPPTVANEVRRYSDLSTSPITVLLIRKQVDKMLHSATFAKAERSRQLLEFVVSKFMKGESEQIKEYLVGVEAFARKEDFNPADNPFVRVHAGRLRSMIRRYYKKEGLTDYLIIDLPKGRYVPIFFQRQKLPKNRDLFPSSRERNALTVALAVLPFPVFGSANDDTLSEGLAEELTHAMVLANIRVAPRTSVLQFKVKPAGVCHIGRKLNVRMILEGGVTKLDAQLRINVRLVSVKEQCTVWSTSFSTGISDSSALHTRLAEVIMNAMQANDGSIGRSALDFLRDPDLATIMLLS